MPSASGATKPGQAFDVVIRNGTVIDGSGADRYKADVGIRNGIIAEVGELDDAPAAREVDASGLFVTPGFVSVHSHADTDELDTAKNMLTQGVTTEVLNADGGGPADVPAQLDSLAQKNLAINVGGYVGFGGVWEEVVGNTDRDPTSEEVSQMQQLVEEAMGAGAWGTSSGLAYTPGAFASTEQVIDVVKAAAPWRTQYTSHIRNECGNLLQATREAVTIGEQGGLAPVITHMKACGPEQWGASETTVGLVKDAIDQDTYAAADQYPYLAGQSSLTLFVPDWAEEGGFEAMLDRFDDPELRPQIRDEITQEVETRIGSPDNLLFPGLDTNLAEVMNRMGVDDPGEAAIRLLEEQDSDVGIIFFYGAREDLVRILQTDGFAVSCDCGSSTDEDTHPRYYGAFPKVLGEFVREQNLLSWEFAIKKMTGIPATMLGMVDRGFIAEGMVADITVFNPDTVIDKATYEEPKQYAEGIEHVLIDGRLALTDGEVTGTQAGQVLRRSRHMPTRPMSSDQRASTSASGVILANSDESGKRPVQVSFSATQDGGPPQAGGHFELRDLRNQQYMQAVSIGQVQATDEWASFTGIGKMSSGKQVPFSVQVEEEDPFHTDQQATVTIHIGDRDPITGAVRPNHTVNADVN